MYALASKKLEESKKETYLEKSKKNIKPKKDFYDNFSTEEVKSPKKSDDGFKTMQSKKKKLPVIYDVDGFIEQIKKSKKANIDFIIDDDAHCDCTFNGKLCRDIKSCNKIHIQRCTYGEFCTKKQCSFIHKKDMCSDDACYEFERTMEQYNKIKANKQVRQN